MLSQHSFHVKVTSHERDNSRRHASKMRKNGVKGLMMCLLIKPKKESLDISEIKRVYSGILFWCSVPIVLFFGINWPGDQQVKKSTHT
ncbi:hypothetical protein [Cylindrospermum stagnale]|uniref:hypothetical protein n=1 Tax=Cylindrospermum stagnale TaxID=142864 RepID=UPI00155AFA84|nr:hypothetical protein [Cylindrospermum stagnale]